MRIYLNVMTNSCRDQWSFSISKTYIYLNQSEWTWAFV